MLITGTASADTLLGQAEDDTIFGWESNDRILDSSGNNIVNGNAGDDTIYGAQGNDLLRGGTGNDILYGDKGDNTVFGDKGNDLIFVGVGNNLVNGNEGDDTIYGAQENDLLRGGKNQDLIFGNAGDDTIYGDWGADTITGMGGDDIFVIGRTNNAITRTTGGPNRITVTIPDGKSSVDVVLSANKDDHAEADEILKLDIANTTNYNTNVSQNNATFTIKGGVTGGTGVTSTKDDASGSNYAFVEGTLRQAIENATFNWQVEEIITFNLLETSPKITLTGNLRRIEDPLKIDGPTNKVTIDGDNQYQIFDVYNTKANFNNLIVINGKGSRNKAGGIQIEGSEVSVSVSNSIFSKNASTYRGGAIHNSNGSTLKVTNTTFDNNVSSSFTGGGAISNNGNLTLINSTISNNSAFSFIGGGGGIANNGTLIINNSTIAKNYSDNSGGGIYNAGKVIASHTIIADNTDSGSSPDFDGKLESNGYNLIGNTTGTNIVGDTTGNILNQSAKLDSLKDNGGLTRTMALLSVSPAINAGNPNFNNLNPDLLYDQRGFDRILQNRIDMGAFESSF